MKKEAGIRQDAFQDRTDIEDVEGFRERVA
jgi:hypothetical protein